MPDRRIRESGSGDWLVVCFCELDWRRHRCETRQEAEAYRCRYVCWPEHRHLILGPTEPDDIGRSLTVKGAVCWW
jgi:hypothetical protein